MRTLGILAALSLLLGLLALAPASSASAQGFPALWVAGPAGIQRLDDRGVPVETLSATPAAFARRTGDTIVFVATGRNEVRELDLRTRRERVLATVPRSTGRGCGGNFDAESELELERSLYFESSLAADADRVCMEVLDRNLNMASVILRIEVDRRSGDLTQRVIVAESCPALPDPEAEALPCTALLRRGQLERSESSPLEDRRFPYRLDEERGAVVGRGRAHRLALREPEGEHASRDGRWLLFSANRDVGDYIYRSLYLLDRHGGRLYSLSSPRPIPRADWGDEERMAEAGTTVLGEDWVGWIDRGRTLRVGSRLILPGRRAVILPGMPVAPLEPTSPARPRGAP